MIAPLAAMLIAVAPPAPPPAPMTPATTTYVLAGKAAPGTVAVAPDMMFSTAAGHGYEPGGPGLFSVAVPPGNYGVTLTLGDPARAAVTTVKAESRRLMLDRVATARGRTVTRSFVVNVRTPALPPPPANAPGGSAVRLNDREQGSRNWDDRLTLELLGTPAVARIQVAPVTVPTVFLAGDSTVTDQPSEPAASWGQMLPALFDEGVAVANHAESGETLKSFITELRLDRILAEIRPGDWLFVQFGHNDQKAQWPQTHAPAATTYRDYLRVYAAEARRRGATPVFVTSPERRSFEPDGRIKPTLADYADAVRAVGRELDLPVIDLNRATIAFYEALGPARAPLAFNDGGRDATHHNGYGADQIARMVAAGIRTSGLPLARHLIAGRPYDPAHPDAPESFTVPASAARSDLRPRGN